MVADKHLPHFEITILHNRELSESESGADQRFPKPDEQPAKRQVGPSVRLLRCGQWIIGHGFQGSQQTLQICQLLPQRTLESLPHGTIALSVPQTTCVRP